MKTEIDICEVKKDETIAEALRRRGIMLVLPCAGNGTCGKCMVRLNGAECLACQTRLSDTGCDRAVIDVPDDMLLHDHDTADGDGHGRGKPWKAAVDLGSTTIETAAVGNDGKVIGSVSRENPQRIYGADVLSRIKAATEGKIAASDMQRLSESTIQASLVSLSTAYGLESGAQEIAIAGNTTMEHLLTADDVSPLGHAPFDPGDISLKNISDVFSDDGTPVYLMPGITAFVGADILSGIYALDMDQSEEYSLLVDLGTNGEMVYGNADGFVVASTAAGPAFEAANISCGCAGVPGAVSQVHFSGQTAGLSLIPWEDEALSGNLPPGVQMQYRMRLKARRPAGLCGSGLVSAVAGMKKAGIIDSNGTYTKDSWIRDGFSLWRPLPASEDRQPLILTQDDIHELLMAKSAIRSGIEILMESVKGQPAVVYLAGGFGSGLSVEDAIDIGLFPEILRSVKIIPAGNTSLKGAVRFITDDKEAAAGRLRHICSICREIRLGDAADFEERYIRNMKI